VARLIPNQLNGIAGLENCALNGSWALTGFEGEEYNGDLG